MQFPPLPCIIAWAVGSADAHDALIKRESNASVVWLVRAPDAPSGGENGRTANWSETSLKSDYNGTYGVSGEYVG